jgi:predicted RecB family endonuclease
MTARTVKEQATKMAMFLGFAVFGLPILVLALFADFYYFWQNNFRSNLKKIIIEKTKSTLSSTSIKDIVNLCNKYAE